MKCAYIFLLFSASILSMEEKPKVHLLLTTALLEKNAEARKKEYQASLKQFASLGYKEPYIVEGVQPEGPSFFEAYADTGHLYYYPGNVPSHKNKGKFEGLSMIQGLKKFNFGLGDFVYKQTGRYFAKRDLIEVVKDYYPGHDAYMRYDESEDIFLLVAYLWKNGKLLEMLDSLDYKAMEQEYNPDKPKPAMIETYATRYIKQASQEKGLDIFSIPGKLGVHINPENSSTGLLSDETEY